jgi:prevent-host-death family protein
MSEISSRNLRNRTREVLERVDAGEAVTITVDGRPAAELRPIRGRGRWMSRAAFIETVVRHQADPALRTELRDLLPDSTDDLPSK